MNTKKRKKTSSSVRLPTAREAPGLDLAKCRSLLRAMEQELKRQEKGLRQPGEPPPFFLSYLMHAKEGLSVWGRYGSVFRSENQRDDHYERALTILRTHRDELDRLAEVLLERETLDLTELTEVLHPARPAGPLEVAAGI